MDWSIVGVVVTKTKSTEFKRKLNNFLVWKI